MWVIESLTGAILWIRDDSDPYGSSGVAGDGPHRHAQLCGAYDYAECAAVRSEIRSVINSLVPSALFLAPHNLGPPFCLDGNERETRHGQVE